MLEVTGNLWTHPVDARVITTNGTIKKDGSAVMGRGCALEAKQMLTSLDEWLGRMLAKHGNHVFVNRIATTTPYRIPLSYLFTFPVKHQWNESAQYSLIEQSAHELVAVVTALDLDTVVMPRPGCGNGHLLWDWNTSVGVRNVIAPILDDRFHVITYPEES